MFKFTEEQLMIRDMVREFTANEIEPRDRDMDENGFDFDLIPKLTEAGLMAIHLPEEYGGGAPSRRHRRDHGERGVHGAEEAVRDGLYL